MVRFILPLSFSDSVMCFYSVAWLETVSTNIFATLGCSGRSLLERGVHNEKHYARANTFMVSCIKHKKKYMHVYNRTIYVVRPLLWCEPLGARLICRLCSNPALQFQTANIYFPLETDFVPTCYFESKNNIAQGSKTCYYTVQSQTKHHYCRIGSIVLLSCKAKWKTTLNKRFPIGWKNFSGLES